MVIKLSRTLLSFVAATLLAVSVLSVGADAGVLSGSELLQDPAKTTAPEEPEKHEVVAVGADYNPNAVLRAARVLFIRSKSVYFKSSDLENEMRQRPEFAAMGLLVTKEEGNADLVLEVGRKVPGRKFVYSAIDPRTQIVLTSGSARADLFGLAPSVAHKIAKRFLERVQAVR
jgi:hypothetical protein